MKTYSEKLRDPKWQRKRLEIMQRDDFQCSYCGDSSETLNVHHRYYITGRNPWEYPNWSLSTLCKSCHKSEHDQEDDMGEERLIPREDLFESVMGFLGARDQYYEDFVWDLGVQMGMLISKIGHQDAYSLVVPFLTKLNQEGGE